MLGEALAHFQDLTDTVLQVGIKRFFGTSRSDHPTMKFTRNISKITDSYFTKYSEIKGKKKK